MADHARRVGVVPYRVSSRVVNDHVRGSLSRAKHNRWPARRHARLGKEAGPNVGTAERFNRCENRCRCDGGPRPGGRGGYGSDVLLSTLL
jgi:hypothetical protein